MGITLSQPIASGGEDSPLAVAAVAEIMKFDLEQLQTLQAAWRPEEEDDEDAPVELALREPDLYCDEFESALHSANFAVSDRAVLERLFTLLDQTGDERVLAVELLISASLLLRGKLVGKLQAALDFASDAEKDVKRSLSPKTLAFVLSTLATTAGYFGDPVVSKADVNRVVFEVTNGNNYSNAELAKHVVGHPMVQQYALGTLESTMLSE